MNLYVCTSTIYINNIHIYMHKYHKYVPLGSTTVDDYQKTEAHVSFQKNMVNGVCSLHINTPTMG